ncbi:hypothetical protein [Salinibacterium sp. ZJ454]|uniref:hypothetical protein n=1 Tax=Salinibacterium sp. ZJ454 TaxID=2708339 RepID=UPI001421EE66|nr:hypothetical protein [Salinibacterium sp. ZJ454]
MSNSISEYSQRGPYEVNAARILSGWTPAGTVLPPARSYSAKAATAAGHPRASLTTVVAAYKRLFTENLTVKDQSGKSVVRPDAMLPQEVLNAIDTLLTAARRHSSSLEHVILATRLMGGAVAGDEHAPVTTVNHGSAWPSVVRDPSAASSESDSPDRDDFDGPEDPRGPYEFDGRHDDPDDADWPTS